MTSAIMCFPNGILRLDTPCIIELRNHSVTDETHISCLQKIFPSAPRLLLSALAAWLLVDLFFCKLGNEQVYSSDATRAHSRYWDLAATSNESLYRIPEKAREMLGINLPESMEIRLNESVLNKRALAVRANVRVLAQNLVEALRGSWDEDLWCSLRVLVDVIERTPTGWL